MWPFFILGGAALIIIGINEAMKEERNSRLNSGSEFDSDIRELERLERELLDYKSRTDRKYLDSTNRRRRY